MPKRRKKSAREEAKLCQWSEVYKSKLRQLDCRKNKKLNVSDIANEFVPSESKTLSSKIFKQPSRKGRKTKDRSFILDRKFLKKTESKAVQTIATNSQECVTQLCKNCNQIPSVLNSSRERELETQHENQIIQTDIDLSKEENAPTSEIEIVFGKSTLACNAENKSKTYGPEKVVEENTLANDISTAHSRRASVDQNLTQDDSEILSPEYSPIRNTQPKVWFETNRAKFDLSKRASDNNKLSEEVGNSKYIPTEKPGVTSNDLGIPVKSTPEDRIYAELQQAEKGDGADLKIDIIQRKPEFAQIESNTLENSNLSKTIIQPLLFATTIKLTEKDKLLSSSSSVKKPKIINEKIEPGFCKGAEENTFEIKNSLDEKKGCPRYAIPLEDISNKDEYHGLPIPILKPIQNHQLPAEFTLHVEKYFFIQNCPVVKCLSYLHRFPHSSPTNVWTFLCPIPSKIRLPNFIFISTASTPLPVLYNKKLYTYFENFMNIYSELKVGNNFILLNLLTDNESPVSTVYPFQFSSIHESIMSTALVSKLGLKINKALPTVIMETESIKNADFDHPCLFKKFGSFKFVSLNIMPAVISENLKEFSFERQVTVSFPFTVQKTSCNCIFVDRRLTLACPIKTFLLALTNNIQFIQSPPPIGSTVKPPEGINASTLQKRKLSPKLDVQKISKHLEFKKRKITQNPRKVTRLKKQESKINVGENITLQTVKRKKGYQTIETNMPKVKRSKTQTQVSFDENILPLNFIKQKPTQYTVANPHKLKYSEKERMISIDGNMQVQSAAPSGFSQSTSPKTVVLAQQPEKKNLFVQKRTFLPFPKSKIIEQPLVLNSEIKLPTYPSVNKGHNLLRTKLQEHYSENKSVWPVVVDENPPLCLVKKSNTTVQPVSKHSATMTITNHKNVLSKSHSSFELKNLKGFNSEAPTNVESGIPNDILEYFVDLPPSSQNSVTTSISNLVQNMSFTANNIKTSIKTISTLTKSEPISKRLNAVTGELINSNSLSITLFNSPKNSGLFSEVTLQHRSLQLGGVKPNLVGFMEVTFFDPIKCRRDPNWRLSVRIPSRINTAFTEDNMYRFPNAILLQSLDSQQRTLKTFLHIRQITSIPEIERFIFDHKNTSAPINSFDKQVFMFQPTPSQKMPLQCEFENLRKTNNSFLPKGVYLLTPVRKNGTYEIEIYKKLKNIHLSELKTEIGACYNLGKECVKVEDLLNIPDRLFFASNVKLTDIY